MIVEVTQETFWKRALNAARRTVGKNPLDKEPSDKWKDSILYAEHSPIRLVEYRISWTGIKQWITVHFARHFLGVEKFIHSQREDRRELDVPRDQLPQGAENDMDYVCNAQSLINISRKRLCTCASTETRKVWEQTKAKISEQDPIMAKHMVRECVYRGFCPELKCCGYIFTKAYHEERNAYVPEDRIPKLNKNE